MVFRSINRQQGAIVHANEELSKKLAHPEELCRVMAQFLQIFKNEEVVHNE